MQTLTMNDQTLCGLRVLSYDFKDKQDGRRVAGTSFYAYFVQEDPLGTPTEVKVTEPVYQRLREAGFGTGYHLVVEVGARNSRVTYTAQEVADASTGESLRAAS